METIFLTILSLVALAPSTPQPLSPLHVRDIGCVAAIAILADEQRRGDKALRLADTPLPDVQADGRKWAGIVGDRITYESGQPREVAAFAMRQAARAERNAARSSPDYSVRVSACIGQMKAELEQADGIK